MITLQNMIFANPQAYQVFPNMVNTYNTGTMEKAVYTGHIVITDSSGNTHNFTNTSTIDFTPISGLVTIDNVTDRGSVQLGRWRIPQSIIITNDITVIVTPIDEVSSDGATITPQYSVKYNTYSNGELSESIVVTPDNVTLQTNVQWITVNNDQIVVSANTNTEARQGQVTIRVQYQEYSTTANYNIVQAGYDIGQDIMQSMVLWYDLKKQGATNESMAENPVLRDLSGNGHDATCYNFSWTEESGISTTNYPHALVSDGVDDCARVTDIGLNSMKTIFVNMYLTSENREDFKFVFSSRDSGSENSVALVYKADITAYNYRNSGDTYIDGTLNTTLNAQDLLDVKHVATLTNENGNSHNRLDLFRDNINGGYWCNVALYSFVAFNRILSTDEIAWVKTNLIETEQ